MNLNQKRSFYIFYGSWFDIFDKLIGVLHPRNTRQFSVWEARRKKSGHLLITYGTVLPSDLQQRHNLREISEPEFRASYQGSLEEHVIHGYNEFNSKPYKVKFFSFSNN